MSLISHSGYNAYNYYPTGVYNSYSEKNVPYKENYYSSSTSRNNRYVRKDNDVNKSKGSKENYWAQQINLINQKKPQNSFAPNKKVVDHSCNAKNLPPKENYSSEYTSAKRNNRYVRWDKDGNRSECSKENYFAQQNSINQNKTQNSFTPNKKYVAKKPLLAISTQPSEYVLENRKCAPVNQRVNTSTMQTKKEQVVVPHIKPNQIKPDQKKMSYGDLAKRVDKHLNQPQKDPRNEGYFVNRCFSLASF